MSAEIVYMPGGHFAAFSAYGYCWPHGSCIRRLALSPLPSRLKQAGSTSVQP